MMNMYMHTHIRAVVGRAKGNWYEYLVSMQHVWEI